MKNKIVKLNVDYTYDPLADVLFVYIKDNNDYEEAIELNPITYLSFNSKGFPVVIEFLDASKVLRAKKYGLQNIKKIDININITKECIKIESSFTIPLHNKEESKVRTLSIGNDYLIPIVNVELITA
ncbi:MAG: DUF2283 domain-containing protein [Methanobrevibacter sp.]|jgi:uncharacterized protein YuzE|nr:DUF2283 domain-containing protein [Methanobrevibacter sp.]